MIHVVAIYNQTQGTGAFRSVLPVAAPAVPLDPQALEHGHAVGLALRIVDRSGRSLWQGPAPFYPSTCTSPDEDRTGLVDAMIPDPAGTAGLQLLASGCVVASFEMGPTPERVTNIHAVSAVQASSRNPMIAWDDVATHSGDVVGGNKVYSVQLSSDDGSSWQTIGLGLRRPSVTVDPHLLEHRDEVKVRVTASNGLRAATREETIPVRELLPGKEPRGPGAASGGRSSS